MNTRIAGTLAAALALTAGCTGQAAAPVTVTETATAQASATPTVSPTATPTPTPSVMTKKEAGAAYLAAVCPSNIAGDKVDDYLDGRYDYQINVAKVRRQARDAVRAGRQAARALDEPAAAWPDNVSKQIVVVTSSLLADVDYYATLSRAKSGAGVISAWAAPSSGPKKERQAVQLVRLRLGLPAAGSKRDGC